MKKLFGYRYLNGKLGSSSYHSGKHFVVDNGGDIVGVAEDIDYLYGQLEKRLDMSLLPYQKTDEFYEVLRLVFRPEDIPFLTHIRTGPTEVKELAERVGLTYEVADKRLREMMYRGVVSWFEVNGHELVALPEYAIGWYEFTLIWLSQEGVLDNFEKSTEERFENLNKMMETYLLMYCQSNFDIRDGLTSAFRVTPMEASTHKEHSVLTYETMKGIMENARKISVLNCACKFVATEESGKPLPEGIPLECCFQIDEAAESVIKSGIGKEVPKEEIFQKLENLAETGHMFNAENNKESGFFCSCHNDWCALRTVFEYTGCYISHVSGFIPSFDEEKCIGCGACVSRCPVDILELVQEEDKKQKTISIVDGGLDVCVGCLSCYFGCKFDVIDYARRDKDEVYRIPDDIFEWSARKALENGRVHLLIFDDPQSSFHEVLRNIACYVENNPISNAIKNNKHFAEFFSTFAGKIGRKDFLKSVGLEDEI